MSDSSSIWFRLGYEFERARSTRLKTRLPALRERLSPPEGARKEQEARVDPYDVLVRAGTRVLAERLLGVRPAAKASSATLLRAALSGLGATVLVEAYHRVLRGNPRVPLDEALLEGAARGVIYGAVVEPRLPAGLGVRAAAFGVVDYMTAPLGGLARLMAASLPEPVRTLARAAHTEQRAEETLVDTLCFALGVAWFYGTSSRSRMGIEPES